MVCSLCAPPTAPRASPLKLFLPVPAAAVLQKKRVCAACSLFQHTIGFARFLPILKCFLCFFLCKKRHKKNGRHTLPPFACPSFRERRIILSFSLLSAAPNAIRAAPCWIIFYWIELRRESISLLSNSDSRFGFWIPDSDSGFFLYWLRLN